LLDKSQTKNNFKLREDFLIYGNLSVLIKFGKKILPEFLLISFGLSDFQNSNSSIFLKSIRKFFSRKFHDEKNIKEFEFSFQANFSSHHHNSLNSSQIQPRVFLSNLFDKLHFLQLPSNNFREKFSSLISEGSPFEL